MQRSHRPILLSLVALPILLAPTLQKRVSKSPGDFKAVVQDAVRAWDAGKYSLCQEALKQATTIVLEKRTETILAALPAPLEGWEIQPERNANQQNPFAAAMGGVVGNIIQRKYKATGGRGRLDVTVTADSPMVSMLGMMFGNPAMLDANSEMIEYEAHKAILKKEGNRLNLQILISGKHVVDATLQGQQSEDVMFGFFDQKAVDALAAALGS